MAAWSKTITNSPSGHKEHLTLPANLGTGTAFDPTYEQWLVAREAAYGIIQSRVLGAGTNFTVVLSGTGTVGHGSGDTITVTVTVP